MSKKKVILSINAGSSSVKVSVYTATASPGGDEAVPPSQIAEAEINGLTAPPARLSYKRRGTTVAKNEVVRGGETTPHGQRDAFQILLRTLVADAELPEIADKRDIGIACHRVVHGGDYTTSKVINADTYHRLEELRDLAPLHNTNALEIIHSCIEELGGTGTVNVAFFDSQFHATLPDHVRTYPIDQTVARKRGLRKYGFHGISYSFIARSVAAHLNKDLADLNIIALHLGSGASACAIEGGKSWDTSMGLTPLAGLPGATRSGSVDPSLVFHYTSQADTLSPMSTEELHISRAEEILNKESGWRALTGTTDFGHIASNAGAGAEASDKACRLAFDLFVNRVCGYVGSYYVALRGHVDALVFAGGIGERSDALRRAVVDQAGCLGFSLDDEANRKSATNDAVVRDIGSKDARHGTLICFTDEQFEMARCCAADAELWGPSPKR
ncbi:Acetokinase family-domain-containing protein [Xylariaceae sp. FL0594]|nr:Acetokinase family-domain-containing protein [Xylariaceae sp. FL0594]